ncbi:nucleotidyltransferase [Enterococcus cecorum]|uniref:nucleotidyltransferase n=1 Tax=Enterococcus cecorum TaxID=44008 RepID=UPI00200A398C|nr:nucleotidyltransferase [Enterococcus cecorum]
MKACGVIVEYNPFHNGHRYHLEQARCKSQADVIICAMSGNFLQRGEAAIIDKWQRANSALQNGADIVLELPFEWAVQSADYFAQGGVNMLAAIGCEYLCFGTDSQEKMDYQHIGQFLHQNHQQLNQLFHQMADEKLSYAENMIRVFQALEIDIPFDHKQPNHILGLSYAKANSQLLKPMTLLAIPRIESGYHEQKLGESRIASATAIRRGIFRGEEIIPYVPSSSLAYLTERKVCLEDFFPYLKFRLLTMDLAELQQIYQMEEGLAFRMKKLIRSCFSYESLINQLKSKRYSQTRIQRLLLYCLLNVRKEEIRNAWQTPSIRILGFTEKGQGYLNKVKKQVPYPLITRVGKVEATRLSLTIRSDEVYRLANSHIQEQNFRTMIKMLKDGRN